MPQARNDRTKLSDRLKPAPEMTEPGLEDAKDAVNRVDRELKRQAAHFRDREKPEVNAGRPADAKLKAERKGVI